MESYQPSLKFGREQLADVRKKKKVNMFHGLYIIEHSSNSCNGNVNTMEILEMWTQTDKCD